MKKKLLTLFVCLALAASLIPSQTGCKTIHSITANTNSMAQIGANIKLGAQSGTAFALQKDPKSRVYFVVASTTLTQLLNSTNTIDPNALATALEQLPVSQLQSPEAQIALTTIIGLYDIYYQQATQSAINSNLVATTLLTNLKDGIDAGLAAVPAPAAPANFRLPPPGRFGVHLKR